MSYHTPDVRVRRTFERQPPQIIITWDGQSLTKDAAVAMVPLLAAAPEMLDLLTEISERAHAYWKKRARALLARIEGEKV